MALTAGTPWGHTVRPWGYEVRVDFTDADGVAGTDPQVIGPFTTPSWRHSTSRGKRRRPALAL